MYNRIINVKHNTYSIIKACVHKTTKEFGNGKKI